VLAAYLYLMFSMDKRN